MAGTRPPGSRTGGSKGEAGPARAARPTAPANSNPIAICTPGETGARAAGVRCMERRVRAGGETEPAKRFVAAELVDRLRLIRGTMALAHPGTRRAGRRRCCAAAARRLGQWGTGGHGCTGWRPGRPRPRPSASRAPPTIPGYSPASSSATAGPLCFPAPVVTRNAAATLAGGPVGRQ